MAMVACPRVLPIPDVLSPGAASTLCGTVLLKGYFAEYKMYVFTLGQQLHLL